MITIQSFGFKYGKPEANIILDVSYFVNPWRDESIRNEVDPPLRREKIFDFMMKQQGVEPFVQQVVNLLEVYDKLFPQENLQVAFCCSAGEYRSPSIAEIVHDELKKRKVFSQVKPNPNSKI